MNADHKSELSVIDLALILEDCQQDFLQLQGKSILVTGGTGFVGKWLLESFLYARTMLEIEFTVYVLSRDPRRFLKAHPVFVSESLIFVEGDIAKFDFPHQKLDLIVHAATETDAVLYSQDPVAMLDAAIIGMKNILRIASTSSVSRVLFTSSGAVYGKSAGMRQAFSEDSCSVLSTVEASSVYGEAKRVCELLGAIASQKDEFDFLVARLFAFVGPHLALDKHFAVGNFIRDGIRNNRISVQGDGTPIRSYMYVSDLIAWLIRILTRGRSCSPYNVGSPYPVTIKELANTVGEICGKKVEVHGVPDPDAVPEKYLPSTEKAETELGVRHHHDLHTAIWKTIEWHRLKD